MLPAEKSIKSAKNTFPGADQFEDLIKGKADHLGITTKEMEKRLRNGSATPMSFILAAPIGMEAFNAWRTDDSGVPPGGGG